MPEKPRPKKYVCSHEGCDKRYSRPVLLAQHERTHTNERPFACDFDGCDKAFFRKSHLEVHKCSHQQDSEMRFRCKICGKGTLDAQRLRRHELTHTKKYKCPYEGCSEAFYHHISCKHHVESVHEKVTLCNICNRRFQNKVLVAKHKLKEHGEGEAYTCKYAGCFSTFVTERSLKDHIRMTHTKVKCEQCGSSFETTQALNVHRLLHKSEVKHTPEKHPKGDHNETLESLHRSQDQSHTIVSDESSSEESEEKHANGVAIDLSKYSASSIIDLVSGTFKTTYKCPRSGCGKVFERKHAFEKHLKKHEEEREKAGKLLEKLKEEEEADETGVSADAEAAEIDSDHFSDIDESDLVDRDAMDEEEETEGQEAAASIEDEIAQRQQELDMLLAQEMQNI